MQKQQKMRKERREREREEEEMEMRSPIQPHQIQAATRPRSPRET